MLFRRFVPFALFIAASLLSSAAVRDQPGMCSIRRVTRSPPAIRLLRLSYRELSSTRLAR